MEKRHKLNKKKTKIYANSLKKNVLVNFKGNPQCGIRF